MILSVIDASRHLKQPHKVFCECEALATLKYRHLAFHFMESGDFEDNSVSKIMLFAQGGLLTG
jgi:hypothetical protein